MLRKTLSAVAAVAAVAAIGVGTAGVANASTPAPTVLCGVPVVAGCTPGHDGHRHFPGGLLGGRGGLLGGLGLGGDFRGGRDFGRFGGTFWNRGGVIYPYSQVVSSCGCNSIVDPSTLGYTEVVNPQQVLVVPEGPVVTGDGSCVALSQVNWGLGGWNRGARFFHHR